MRSIKINIFIFVFVVLTNGIVKGESTEDTIISKLKTFAYTYQPTLFDGTDTLAVPRLPRLDDQLNSAIYSVLESQIDSVDDYAFLIVVKLFYGQELLTKFSYDMCYAGNNVILDICLKRIQSLDENFIVYECFDVTTWDIYMWASKHKFLFDDSELQSILSTIDKYMATTYKED